MKRILCFHSNDRLKDFLSSKFDNINFILGDVQDYDNYLGAGDVEIITSFTSSKFNKKNIDKFPNLKLICTRSVSADHVSLEYCREKGIDVSNVPWYGQNTVAEFTFALMLALSRKAFYAYEKVRDDMNFSRRNTEELTGFDLKGKTIGIIGVGRIGSAVAKIANGFSMKILGFDKYPNKEYESIYNINYVSLDILLAKSDIITIHLPYNKSTSHIINSYNIENINKGAVLINTSEGEVLDTIALKDALDKDILSYVALDTLEMESAFGRESADDNKLTKEQKKIKKVNKELVKSDRVIITPHNSFNTKEALDRVWHQTEMNIRSFVTGKGTNIIN